MTNRQALVRFGIWLAFLIAAVCLPLLYFFNAPAPIGSGLMPVLGWGAVIGIGTSVAIFLSHRPIFQKETRGGKIKIFLICVWGGTFGGASGAALLDQNHVVNSYAVELPIVKIRQRGSSRRREDVHIETIEPLVPTLPVNIMASSIRSPIIREGDCLIGRVEQGFLGGMWVRAFDAQPCSNMRGRSVTHVLTTDGQFSSWRWHRPHNPGRTNQGE